MADNGDKFYEKFFTLTLVLGMVFYVSLIFFHGWTWHVVPLGAPPLGYWTVFALMHMKAVVFVRMKTTQPGVLESISTGVSLAISHAVIWVCA